MELTRQAPSDTAPDSARAETRCQRGRRASGAAGTTWRAGPRLVDGLVSGSLNFTSRIAPPLAGWAAFTLFRRPFVRARMSSRERTVLDGAHRGSLTVGDKTVVTYRWGNGARPVLLVHGWRSRAARFAEFVPELLEGGYSPIGFDAPGHGESGGTATTLLEYRDIISQLAAQYGTFEAVVAHSFGVLASFVALREGERVQTRRLVTISGVAELDYLIDRFCALLRLRPRLNRELRTRVERNLYAGEADIWERFCAGYRAESVRIPILVIHDEHDGLADITQSQRILAAYPSQTRALITQNLGHRTLRDASVITAVSEFIVTERRR
jgi:pimeloyl-ACP methyl ester carboxylesterase